jgi:UDP-N-acetylmuramate dehydrogenase
VTVTRLADLTTLRLGGPAGAVVEAATTAELVESVRSLDAAGEHVLVVGGGSNLVVADEGFPGTVVLVRTAGVTHHDLGDGRTDVRVAAGEAWDPLVEQLVGEGLAGLEPLSGIPGLVGATPIQNVGAYGTEVARTVVAVDVLDRTTGREGTLDPADCGFGYRTSALKTHPRHLVTGVTFRLRHRETSDPVAYDELARALGVPLGGSAPLAEVRAAVLDLRRGKGMVLDPDDPDTVSAGSFFTNPVVEASVADGLPDGAPRWPAGDGRVKLSAAWLIERAGFPRGYAYGRARISTKHTLALTNPYAPDGATTAELLALAAQVVAAVRLAFDVRLTPEPVLVGCSLPG